MHGATWWEPGGNLASSCDVDAPGEAIARSFVCCTRTQECVVIAFSRDPANSETGQVYGTRPGLCVDSSLAGTRCSTLGLARYLCAALTRSRTRVQAQ